MNLNLLPISLFFCLFGCLGGGNANTVFSVVPTTVGVGTQNLVSNIPGVIGPQQLLTTGPTAVQPNILQLLRHPSGVVSLNGGLTQLVLPGQQQQTYYLNGAGEVVPLATTGVTATNNGLGLTTIAGLQYPYSSTTGLTMANVNGVPVLVSSGGLTLNNGLPSGITTIPQVGAIPTPTSVVQHPFISQPVVREVQEVETPASLVQLDPMDAALLDMENKGQMHMEKYAWGRTSLRNKGSSVQQPTPTVDSDNNAGGELRSDISRYYAPLPTGSIVSSQPLDILNQNRVVGASSPTTQQSQIRNPFVDANGKRKKHFEFYQYFRNLNMNPPQQMAVPVAFLPSGNIGNE